MVVTKCDHLRKAQYIAGSIYRNEVIAFCDNLFNTFVHPKKISMPKKSSIELVPDEVVSQGG